MSANKRQRSLTEMGSWSLSKIETGMVLARLPADDLARFNLVCKNWRYVISQSDPSNHRILIQADAWVGALPGPFRSVIICGSPSAKIVGSVNGLICKVGNYCDGGSPNDIWILNPLTSHSIKLPLPPSPVDLTLCDSRVTFAFWCDSVTNAYKVARIVSYPVKSDPNSNSDSLAFDPNPNYPQPNRGDVWDSSSQTWMEIPICFGRPFLHSPFTWISGCDIIVGGCAYWIVVDFNNDGLFVLSLELETLLVRPISLPHLSMKPPLLINCFYINQSFFFLTNRKGKLALVARKQNWTGDFPLSDIKEVGDMHNLWTIKDGRIGAWNPPISIHLDFFKCYLLKYINGKLLLWRAPLISLYDMETQSFEDLALHDVSVASAHDFVGSFVTINGFKTDPDISHLLPFVWLEDGSAEKTNEYAEEEDLMRYWSNGLALEEEFVDPKF